MSEFNLATELFYTLNINAEYDQQIPHPEG
jgi:hypothetical protein